MKVPEARVLATPILSYHHGDPELYRGRPAGFYELLHRAPVMGQIIQQITDRLDAGSVLAFAETKVLPHSYRATLVEAYRHSPLLINQAIANALASIALPKVPRGRNYRLPSNITVMIFIGKMIMNWIKRLAYGAFVEKRWQVSTAQADVDARDQIINGRFFPPSRAWDIVPISKSYTFYADPFFSQDPAGLLVEGLNRRTGLGELVLIQGSEHRTISNGHGHFSYPFCFQAMGGQIVVPETATWSSLTGYSIEQENMRGVRRFQLRDGNRVFDPTLIEQDGRIYLFGNCAEKGGNVLMLWSAASLDDEFQPHPASPIRVSPRGSRMAGAILRTDNRLIRFGQDFVTSYGHGIFAFEIKELSAEAYSETLVGEVRFSDRRGPHTLNFDRHRIAFDWYTECVTPFAGLRRVLAVIREQRALSHAQSANCSRSEKRD